ncbi:endonuclease VIII [Budvicia diplopodorum]|uniref:endonuclease VIII n=1 Tax=Budvicia diplopodorum TaxID=1119056 RepID=UPI00135CF5B8|nr:endonuclease VIII [Budvicia diplopodorum]
MPEGPEIRRAADKLVTAIEDKQLASVWFAFPQLKGFESSLVGQRVERIETRGKALLTHFSNGLTMYSHNQLYGLWKVVDAGERPQTKRDLRVVLEASDKAILLYSASDIEIGPRDAILQHRFLQRIGPDILDNRLTVDAVAVRLLDKRFVRRQLGGMLLDQSFLAGLGNYLRAEILWDSQLLPAHKPEDLTSEQLTRLASSLLTIPRLSYMTRGDDNPNYHHGALFAFQVFSREGQACSRCGDIIQKTSLSSRPFFYCAGCQY